MASSVDLPLCISKPSLHAYLLGTVDFEAGLRLQQRLHYDIGENSNHAALILCEHPPVLTMGRSASRAHLRVDPAELGRQGLTVRWVNRGGGAIYHMPGQLAIYPILPLDRFELKIPTYLQKLGEVICQVLSDFSFRGEIQATEQGVTIAGRQLVDFGVAVRGGISYYGAYLNLNPDLDDCRIVHRDCEMTSLERERRAPVRPALVREKFMEVFSQVFAIDRTLLFSDHPILHTSPRWHRPSISRTA